VTDLVVTEGAALVLVTVVHESGEVETIETTDEHPFYVECRSSNDTADDTQQAFVRADALQPGDRLRTMHGTAHVLSVAFTAQRETVYNFTVGEHHTYLVGRDGVVVHNCDLIDNIGRHALQRAHNWELAFGRIPTLEEVKPIIMEVAQSGQFVSQQTMRAAGGVEVGVKQQWQKVINGVEYWAHVFIDDATGTLRVQNGGVVGK
jgi:Pretoxin HINT domain